jgi:hypothetical protein
MDSASAVYWDEPDGEAEPEFGHGPVLITVAGLSAAVVGAVPADYCLTVAKSVTSGSHGHG